MTRFRHDLILRMIKLLDAVLVTIPFAMCWYLYYAKRVASPYYAMGDYLVVALFFVLFIIFGRVYDAFLMSMQSISEIIYEQFLAAAVSDFIKLKVNHEFDIFGQIEFYESLWDGAPSAYKDYGKTKANVLSLKPYIDAHASEKVLTHIDAVPDNFLFVDRDGCEEIRLIDWEYAGMQDPHVDVAMFCIYSLYNKRQVDRLISAYFTEGCDNATRIKIYCYIAACGLLWSNWCEYKRNLGVEFGEYSLRQYRYAKDYYRIVQDELKKLGESGAQKNA